MSLPTILAWNYRGLGSKYAMRHLFMLIRNHNPDILLLFETRVASDQAQVILDNSHFNDFCAAKAMGFVGGIWILWDNTKLN